MENIFKEMQCQKCRKHFKKKNKNHRTLAKKAFGFNKVAGGKTGTGTKTGH